MERQRPGIESYMPLCSANLLCGMNEANLSCMYPILGAQRHECTGLELLEGSMLRIQQVLPQGFGISLAALRRWALGFNRNAEISMP